MKSRALRTSSARFSPAKMRLKSFQKYFFSTFAAFQLLGEYRLDFLLRIFGAILTNSALFFLWFFLALDGMDVRPYTPTTLAYYYFFISLAESSTAYSSAIVTEEIKDGRLGNLLLKPINYFVSKFFLSLPEKFFYFLAGFLFLIIIRFFGFGMNLELSRLGFFVLALGNAVIGGFLMYFIIGLLAFWTKQTWGFQVLLEVGAALFSGKMVPFHLLPETLKNLAALLPFKYFVFFPVQVLTEKVEPPLIFAGFFLQLAWIVVLYLTYLFLWKSSAKRVEIVGI